MKAIIRFFPLFHLLALLGIAAMLVTASEVSAVPRALPSEKTSWHGFDRYDFIMDEATLAITPFQAPQGEGDDVREPAPGKRRCVLVMPKQAAEGHPWSWRGCYWNHQPQTEIELLKHGFSIAYISANATLKPGKEWEAWYAYLTGTQGLSPKPAFIGMSRGGHYAYLWATTHPDQVSCIYADNPFCDHEIVGNLKGLADRDVPVLHVCGSLDPLFAEGTAAVEAVYPTLGGRVSVIIKEGFGHHPHSLHDPKPIVDFILQSQQEKTPATPDFVGDKFRKSWFYGTAGTYQEVPAEGAYLTCRGPFFTPPAARYAFELPGISGFTTVIVPATPAPGNPWVLRAEFVRRDASVDLALLAKGFSIVVAPVPYVADGPQLDKWNAVYQHLVDHGFAKRAAMEGEGAAAGEVFGWAIANPDKVSCIYAENPMMRSHLLDKPLLESLAPLAKAGVPLLNICGSLDPWFEANARVLEQRYLGLSGSITVLMRKDEGHTLLASPHPQQAVDFISQNAAR